jgi:hypothetical protein
MTFIGYIDDDLVTALDRLIESDRAIQISCQDQQARHRLNGSKGYPKFRDRFLKTYCWEPLTSVPACTLAIGCDSQF